LEWLPDVAMECLAREDLMAVAVPHCPVDATRRGRARHGSAARSPFNEGEVRGGSNRYIGLLRQVGRKHRAALPEDDIRILLPAEK